MFDAFIRLFFPEHCRGCGKSGRALCSSCIAHIPRSAPLASHMFAVYDYGHTLVRWTIRDLKYNRKSESARALAFSAAAAIRSYLPHTQLIFVPIPGHSQKVRARGFNQSILIAQWWSRCIRDTRVEHLLKKVVFTLPQAHLKRHERLHNVRDTMVAIGILDPLCTYVIVDDVTTTGSTFAEAERALRTAGAHHVYSVALAHGYAHK